MCCYLATPVIFLLTSLSYTLKFVFFITVYISAFILNLSVEAIKPLIKGNSCKWAYGFLSKIICDTLDQSSGASFIPVSFLYS